MPWVVAVEDPGGELMAAADAELGEGVSEVVLDGLGAQVQLGGRFAVGQPGGHQPCHPQFLGGEPRQAGVATGPGPQAGTCKLRFAGLHEGNRSQDAEDMVSGMHRIDGGAVPLQLGQAPTMLKIQQPAVERQGLAARRAAGSPQHLVGLAEVATGLASEPRSHAA